jgi:YggT family protein
VILRNGGAGRDRTDDLSSAIAALSQLSYGPIQGMIPKSCRLFREDYAPREGHLGIGLPACQCRSIDPLVKACSSGRLSATWSGKTRRFLMYALLYLIDSIISLYIWVVILSAIFSWLIAFNVVNTNNRIVISVVDMLWRLTEPALRPIRSILPNLGGIDISPVILILLLLTLQTLIDRDLRPILLGPDNS